MNTVVEGYQHAVDVPAAGLLGWAERGWIPDPLLRLGIRRLCRQRLREESRSDAASAMRRAASLISELRASPVAIHTDDANRQHYELPPAFFVDCLGPRLKYSSCYYPEGDESLAEAEEAMLQLYSQRAQLRDGQDILELGCGWGSLTLWMAERYPSARITAVSNSSGQKAFIDAKCRARGFENVEVITRDVNELSLPEKSFDRCVSIEMFEHMRNYATLLERVGGWLRDEGRLFVHIFCHRTLLYPFETSGVDDWMGRHFFTGGLMPAADTLLRFQAGLRIEDQWLVDGTHYARTANHWLQNQDKQKARLMPLLQQTYGESAALWYQRWRMFWMSCAELFAYGNGQEWMVAHYRFVKEAA